MRDWRLTHAGALPRQRSDNAVEAALARWFSKALQRRQRALGNFPSQRQLTPDEAVHLNSIVDLAMGDASANAPASESIDTAAETPAAVGSRPHQRRPAEPVPNVAPKRPRTKTPPQRTSVPEAKDLPRESGVASSSSCAMAEQPAVSPGQPSTGDAILPTSDDRYHEKQVTSIEYGSYVLKEHFINMREGTKNAEGRCAKNAEGRMMKKGMKNLKRGDLLKLRCGQWGLKTEQLRCRILRCRGIRAIWTLWHMQVLNR